MTDEERWAAAWRYEVSGRPVPAWRREKQRRRREERIPIVVLKQGGETVGVVAGRRSGRYPVEGGEGA